MWTPAENLHDLKIIFFNVTFIAKKRQVYDQFGKEGLKGAYSRHKAS